jgi:hypothetical protein
MLPEEAIFIFPDTVTIEVADDVKTKSETVETIA